MVLAPPYARMEVTPTADIGSPSKEMQVASDKQMGRAQSSTGNVPKVLAEKG